MGEEKGGDYICVCVLAKSGEKKKKLGERESVCGWEREEEKHEEEEEEEEGKPTQNDQTKPCQEQVKKAKE